MPTPLKDWEINNIGYFIREFLRIKFRDAALEIISPLAERDEHQHILTVKATKILLFKKADTSNGKCVRKLHLDDSRTLDIQISKSRADENVYKIYIQNKDLILIRYFINHKISKILNQYFVGEAIQQWQVYEEFIESSASLYKKLANTPDLRVFQMPKLKEKPGMLDLLVKTFGMILKEVANYTIPSDQIVKKELPSIFGGIIGHRHIKNQGKYLYITGYSLELFYQYHNKRNEYLSSVVYWIQNAFKNSVYSMTHFNIVHQLEPSSSDKYTMVASLNNNTDLPKYLSLVLDNWQILFKSLSLGKVNNFNYYKFTLSATAVMFLINYYYKRIVEALNEFSGFKGINSNSWLMYVADGDKHCSKVCITLFTDTGVSKTLRQEHLKILWKRFTNQDDYLFKLSEQTANKNEKLPVTGEVGGHIEAIMTEPDRFVIGFLYNTSSLDKILSYLQRNDLHLSPTPSTQIDNTDTYHYVHARLFNGASLVDALPKSVAKSVTPLEKHAKFAEQTTQSPLINCIFDESQHLVDPNDLNHLFPKKEFAKNIQFFKKQSVREIEAQYALLSKSPSIPAQPLSPLRSLSQQASQPEVTSSRKRSLPQQISNEPMGAQPLSCGLANDSQPLLLKLDDQLPALSVEHVLNPSPDLLRHTEDLLPPPVPKKSPTHVQEHTVKSIVVASPLPHEPEEQQPEEVFMGAQPLTYGSY